MAVRCPDCNEELLGAVNRCWRCGRQFAVRVDASGLPPVRRSPPSPAAARVAGDLAAGEFVVAELGDGEPGSVRGSEVTQALAAAGALPRAPVENPSTVAGGSGVRRVGSPFLEGDRPATGPASRGAGAETRSPAAVSRGPVSRGPVSSGPVSSGFAFSSEAARPTYPAGTAAVGGAIGALVLGVLSLIACSFTNAALVTSLLGLAMGVWGLYSTRRRLAVVGLLVCLLAMGVSGFNGAVDLYTYMEGRSPFAPEPAYEDSLE